VRFSAFFSRPGYVFAIVSVSKPTIPTSTHLLYLLPIFILFLRFQPLFHVYPSSLRVAHGLWFVTYDASSPAGTLGLLFYTEQICPSRMCIRSIINPVPSQEPDRIIHLFTDVTCSVIRFTCETVVTMTIEFDRKNCVKLFLKVGQNKFLTIISLTKKVFHIHFNSPWHVWLVYV